MYASVRQYRSSDASEVGRRASEGFVPIVKKIPGVSAWYLIDGGDGTLVTVTLSDDQAGADASVKEAAQWVGENAADLVEGSPNVTNGEVVAQS